MVAERAEKDNLRAQLKKLEDDANIAPTPTSNLTLAQRMHGGAGHIIDRVDAVLDVTAAGVTTAEHRFRTVRGPRGVSRGEPGPGQPGIGGSGR